MTGIDNLYVFDGGYVYIDTNGSMGADSMPGEIQLASVHVQDRGTFELFSYDKHVGMEMNLTNLTVSV